MNIDISAAFKNGNRGITIYPNADGFMVSVKTASGGFTIGYGATPTEGLADALKPPPRGQRDLFGDLL